MLILIAAAALVAPLFVDWNSYRAEFEDHGRKLTGRDVTIAGGIEARLFPWPVLVLNQVKIANLEGSRRANFMEARRIEMGMSLAPLISGEIEVDAIAIDGPVFALERLAAGATSWTFEPEQSLAALIDLDRVAVSQISVTNGTVFAGDHRRGGLARIDEFAGTLSAPALSGPWRLRATASHAGLPFEINLTTGKLKPGEPARVGLRIAPVADAGVVYSFDGEIGRREGKSVKGALKITPTLSDRGKGDAETGLRPFEVKADIEADFDTVALTRIEASPAFSSDPGNFITGAAEIALGSQVVVRAALSSARFDLDQIAGRRGRDLMRSAGAMEELGRFFAAVPEGLELHLDLAAASVVMGGETLDASRLKLQLSPERLSIDEFTTTLPGQTGTRFSGALTFGEEGPLMSGDISVESVSLRDFVVWAIPERKSDIEEVWSGIRGRLMLQAKIDAAPQGVRLSEVRATLDDAGFTGSLSSQTGPDPGLALRIDADRLDLDRYLPRGFAQWSGESGLAMSLVDLVSQAMTVGDFQFTAQAGQLRFHGVEAQDIAIDVGANETGVELRTVEIGQVGAARMDVAGLLRFPGEGVAGSINAVIEAEDPRGLLRLLGAFGSTGGIEPAWAEALGPLDVKLIAEATAEDRITTGAMALTGTAGGASASVEGKFRGERANWQDGEIELSGEMEAQSGALVAAITGLEPQRGPDRPTRLAGSLAGSLSGGLATSLEAELFGARSQFVGTIKEGRRSVEAEGRIAVLAEDAAQLFALVGVPADELNPLTRVLAAESQVRYDGRGLLLSGLSGTAGRASFSGDLNVVASPVRRVSGQIATTYLSLPWLLGAVLLPRDGMPHALSSHFASALPSLEADLAIAAERLVMLPHIAFEASELDFKLGRFDLTLDGRGAGPGGEPAMGRIEVGLDSRGVVLAGAVEGPVALGALLRANDGRQVIDADGKVALTFSGSGRSPAGVLAALEAEGSYELARGVLKRVDPETFARDLAAAKQPSEIDGLFTGSLRSGDMAFVGGSGTLKLAEGVLQAKPLAILGEDVTGEARFVLEAASGEVDLSFTLSLAEQKSIPTFELAYAGSPWALEPSTDAQNLKSYLAMRMLQESVQQLEEVQRQERKLIEEEMKFQREQQQREELRREQQRRDAEQKLDRKERELAARRRIEERKAEELKAEERKAEERKAEEPKVEERKVEEPKVEERKVEEPKVEEREPEPAAVTVLPLDAPPSDPVPLPRLKPEPGPDTARVESAEPVQLPRDGNLGRIAEPIFSGPAILQPELSGPNYGPARLNR